jgi:ribosomal protein L37AE/L43A
MTVTEWIPWAVRLAHQKTECEHCGSVGPRLGLHHKDEDRTNNSPENLLTLCPKCHTALHWKNGKRAWKRLGLCDVCGLPARKYGLCPTHASRYYRHGSPYLKKIKIGSEWRLVEVHS